MLCWRTIWGAKGLLLPVSQESFFLWSKKKRNEQKRTNFLTQGDGQSDSPGSCAKYTQVSVLDIDTDKILWFELLQVSMSKNSVVMERDGVKRALQNLEKRGKFAKSWPPFSKFINIVSIKYAQCPEVEVTRCCSDSPMDYAYWLSPIPLLPYRLILRFGIRIPGRFPTFLFM